MAEDRKIPLLVSLPQEYLDVLRRLSAQEIFDNPREVSSAAKIAREIICAVLDGLMKEEKDRTDPISTKKDGKSGLSEMKEDSL